MCDTMQVKHISLIHIVNKSSKFNKGLSEFVIVGYSLLLLLLITKMSQTKHSFEVRGKSQNLLFICYNVGMSHSVS